MPKFELDFPAEEERGFAVTATVEADSAMSALRLGLERLGNIRDIQRVHCDITGDGIEVHEPGSERTFVLRTVRACEQHNRKPNLVVPHSTEQPDDAKQFSATDSSCAGSPDLAGEGISSSVSPDPGGDLDVENCSNAMNTREAEHQLLENMIQDQEKVVLDPFVQPVLPIAKLPLKNVRDGADKERKTVGLDTSVHRKNTTSGFEALFEDTEFLYECADLTAAGNFILQKAMSRVQADAAAVLLADINRHDLRFLSAAGWDDMNWKSLRLNIGDGVAGFAVLHGVTVAVSDLHVSSSLKIARSERAKGTLASILCVPMQREGRAYGAIELLCCGDPRAFSDKEIAGIDFLAAQFCDYIVRTSQ